MQVTPLTRPANCSPIRCLMVQSKVVFRPVLRSAKLQSDRLLVIEQPRVDGVTDGAYPRDAAIQLEMPEGIPVEGAHSVTGLDPEPQQRTGEPLGSALGLGIGVAMDRSFDGSRDDLGVTMIGCCVDEDRRYEERPLLPRCRRSACP